MLTSVSVDNSVRYCGSYARITNTHYCNCLTDAHNTSQPHEYFPVAAARVWNSLLATVTSSPSLLTFKRRLKTELFARSYPDC